MYYSKNVMYYASTTLYYTFSVKKLHELFGD